MEVHRFSPLDTSYQVWRQEFWRRGLILPTKRLKYGNQGTINAKNLRKRIVFHLPTVASMLQRVGL